MTGNATMWAPELPPPSRPSAPGRLRWLVRGVVALLAAAAVVLCFGLATIRVVKDRLGPLPMQAAEALSVTVLDRNDRLLRAFTTPDGRWRLPLEPGEVDPRYLAILMAFEDQRFYEHGGVDPRGFARAALQFLRSGHIVSGGSTLTMQVARLLDGRHERTAAGKLRQVARALQVEERFSKKDILRLYLRLAPFGGNIEGVRAASLAYFGKEPRRLSVGEAALLVALPQSPENRRPDRSPEAARVARDRVLDRAVAAGVISGAEAEHAKSEAVPTERREFPRFSPHLAEEELAAKPGQPVLRTTLDRSVQAALETLAGEQTRLMGEKLSSAILAVDHTTGEVIAYVGSSDYLDETRFGAIDMIQAIRSPGSTLKPMIYGLAFEAGLAHPETLIEDRPTRFGTYAPENFDEEFHGTVTIRQALANSLNVPAVKVLAAVGPGKLVGRMRRAGIATELPAAETQPKLAIALGGLGIRLQDLTQLFAGLARGGDPVTLTWRRDAAAMSTSTSPREAVRRRLLSPVAAWYVTDILRGAPTPANVKGGSIAYKTGTSYGYRDAWAIGYDGRHTVAVWVGRPDGIPTPGLMGRLTAAPILFDAFSRISEKCTPLRSAPAGTVQASGATLPEPLKRFREGPDEIVTGPYLAPPVLIAFPPDRAELDVEEREDEPLILKADGGALPLTWLVDGRPIASEPKSREVAWQPDERGFVKLQVVDANGKVDRVTVRLR